MIVMRMTKTFKEKYFANEKQSDLWTENVLFTQYALADQSSKESEAATKLPQKNVCFEYFTTAENSNADFWLLRKKRRKQKSGCQLNSQLACLHPTGYFSYFRCEEGLQNKGFGMC